MLLLFTELEIGPHTLATARALHASVPSFLMPSLLTPVIAFYDYALQPLPAFARLGVPVSTLDIAAALRLAVSLRQVRQLFHDRHVSRISATNGRPEDVEPRSLVRDFIATLVIVHGGEAIAGASQGGG